MSTPTATTTKKGWGGPITLILFVAAMAVMFGQDAIEYAAPNMLAGLRLITSTCGTHEVVMVGQARPAIQGLAKGYDDRAFGDRAKSFASEDAARKNDCDAAIARDKREVPLLRDYFVPGNYWGWKVIAPVHEPMHFISPMRTAPSRIEQICSDSWGTSRCSDLSGLADPIPENRFTLAQVRREGEGLMTLVTPPPPPGKWRELRGQVCNNGTCSASFPTTTEAFICGDRFGGTFLAGTNYVMLKAGVEIHDEADGTKGQFSIEFLPDAAAQAACASHPGMLVVYPEQPAPTAVVAKK